MTTFIAGGTGFIGRRLVPLLAQRGEEIVCMDINPQTADFGRPRQSGARDPRRCQSVRRRHERDAPRRSRRGSSISPIGSAASTRRGSPSSSTSSAWTTCFEAARLVGCNRVAYASSLAVSGEQKFYGDRIVTEDDFRHGHVQYAMHKIFNEWQAQDYREKHGMEITAIRPANVTGPDKIVGSVDHVFCITDPARGKPVKFPYKDAMRCPIHVDEIAEIFARVIMTDKPQHGVYNTGGQAISLGDLADIVRGYLPDAQITFDKETGGRELSGNYLIDNTRLVSEFGVQYRPYRERVLQIINDIRKEEGLPQLAPQ